VAVVAARAASPKRAVTITAVRMVWPTAEALAFRRRKVGNRGPQEYGWRASEKPLA
jgi:hypothetical protein